MHCRPHQPLDALHCTCDSLLTACRQVAHREITSSSCVRSTQEPSRHVDAHWTQARGPDEDAEVDALLLFAASHARPRPVIRRTVAVPEPATSGRSASTIPAAESRRSRSMSPVFVTCFGKVPVSISRRNSNGTLLPLHRVDVLRPDRRPDPDAVTRGTV